MRFYGNVTQQQVADRLHCSQMHVSRSQTNALAFLRSRLLPPGTNGDGLWL
jgi:DNA-directed RNA polymerase specialized sigma subunit